jgi:hypothetical protein
MASFRQIEANRRNAQNSTGPKTEGGKQRSRGNAVRHGLTAETVIDILEDPEDYKAFELSVTADFDAQTAVERELVLRLASLLWRLRRATAIETGLLQIQNEILRQVRPARRADQQQVPERVLEAVVRFNGGVQPEPNWDDRYFDDEQPLRYGEPDESAGVNGQPHRINVEIGRCFLRLANLDNGAFDRANRYETALWRQVGQVLFTLDSLRRAG